MHHTVALDLPERTYRERPCCTSSWPTRRGALAATSKRSEKAALLADVLRRLAPEEVAVAVGVLTGAPRQGRIGVGWATLRDVRVEPADRAVADGARGRRGRRPAGRDVRQRASTRPAGRCSCDVFARATEPEQDLLWKMFGGELRQGALDGVMVDAVAKAAGVPIAAVRRAHMLAGDLGATAAGRADRRRRRAGGGRHGAGRAVQPMLASPAPDVAAALAATGPASVEWKLDGARIQAHRRDGQVRIFTRNLNEITDRLGAVSARSSPACPGGDLVLDGEALGVDDEGAPRRFQDTMGDFGADAVAGRGHGLSAYFFDVLHAGGAPVVDEPLAVRRELLASVVPASPRLPSIVTADADEAAAFLDRAVDAGHEGVMVKALDAPYDAGRRGGAWRKIKPVHTLDLVVLAAEWGHGRRTGLAVEPAPRRARRRRRVRDGRQDVQGADRRAAALADRPRCRRSRSAPRPATSCTSGPSWSSRSPSTASRPRPATPAASPCASPASAATAPTSPPPTPTTSPPSRRCS